MVEVSFWDKFYQGGKNGFNKYCPWNGFPTLFDENKSQKEESQFKLEKTVITGKNSTINIILSEMHLHILLVRYMDILF